MPVTTTDSPRKTRKRLRVTFTPSSTTIVKGPGVDTIVAQGLVNAEYNAAVDASSRSFKAKIEAVGRR